MSNKTPLEIWIVSSINKTSYPTGNYKVKPRKIRKQIPFNITKSEEIIFYRNLIKANGNGKPFRELTLEEVGKLNKYNVVDEVNDEAFKRRRINAEAEIKALKEQIHSLKSIDKATQMSLINMKTENDDLNEALALNDESGLSKEIEVLSNENKNLHKKVKSLESKIKKLKNEVN